MTDTSTEARKAPLFLEHHVVDEPAFAKAVEPIGSLLMQAKDGGDTVLALEQDLRWYGGRVDRIGIDRAVVATGPGFQSLTSLERGAFVPMAVLTAILQCAIPFNRPLNIACSGLARPDETSPGGKLFEGRALFIAGGIVVVSDNDFEVEADLRGAATDSRPRRIGKVLVPDATSNHAVMAGHAAARTGAMLLTALLRRKDITPDITLCEAESI